MPPARKPPPGNPLWIEWLQAWETEMAEKSEHMPKVIRRAIKSFEQCPVPIDHPANAGTLRHVGEKTMRYLTKRLKAYCEEHNLEIPQATYTTFEREAAKINKKKRKNGEADEGAPLASGSARVDSNGDEAEINTSPPKKPRKTKAYVPRTRSGPWAILIGLASYGTGAWKSEAEVIQRADPFFGEDGQSLKDRSSGGGAGSQFYTAWSSSKTLFTKGYVEKRSRNPVLYQITYEGWKIARKAVRNAKRNNDINLEARSTLPDFETEDEESESDQSNTENRPVSVASTSALAKPKAQTQTKSNGKGRERHISEAVAGNGAVAAKAQVQESIISPTDPTAPFLFSYLTEDNVRVKAPEQADNAMCPETFTTLFRVEVRQCQAKHIFAKKNVVGAILPVYRGGAVGPEGATFSAYLRAKAAPACCPSFDSLKALPKFAPALTSLSPKRPSSSQSSPQAINPDNVKRAHRTTVLPTVALPAAATSSAQASSSRSIRAPPAALLSRASSPDIIELEEAPPVSLREKMLRAVEARTSQQSSSSPARIDYKGKGKAVLLNAFEAMQAAATVDRVASGSTTPAVQMTVTADGYFIPDIDTLKCETWKPDDYTIRLIIDNREQPGLSNKKLEDMLTAKGIVWEARALNMGDAIWLAKSKATGAEVVLDACLERKRLDDLLSSMRDGRYMEQKNRMLHSGISQLIYLVEEHDSKKAMETWGRQIWTMKSSLQIVDNFTVHIAWNTTDACNYLARLTKTFVDIYKDITLTVLPDECMDKSHHVVFMKHLQKERPGRTYVYTVASFQELNRKQHSLHAGWAKMVASVNQMSLALTEHFLRKWPTPSHFFEHLEETAKKDEEVRIKMAEEEALGPYAKKRAKKDDPKIGECWVMRETEETGAGGVPIKAIGQALSTHCWKLFAGSKY